MKILYIFSGFPGIYYFFDNFIINELNNEDHICKGFNHFEGMDSLKLNVLEFEPDLVFTMTGFILPEQMTEWLKDQKNKLAVWMTEDPYYMDKTVEIINRYDYIFTIDRASLEHYQKNGHPHVYLLPLGTDPNTFSPSTHSDEQELIDICLVGYPYPDRIELIKFLLKETQYTIEVVGGKWKDELREWSKDQRLKITDWQPPHKVVNYYNNAKIILNTHRPQDLVENNNSMGIISKSINNRTFDVASCGAFQLISHQPDLRYYFSEKEMVSFESQEELIEKIHFYIKNEEKRKEIALNAREVVLKHHTFAHRIKEIIAIVQKNNKSKSGPG
ncbi:CgeB family protein [Priestia endophytica]|uniref:CgeB family protein n=1 Tax=Priestia endophytica TaxID=135735 RepID=UPI00124DAF8C|nr:glycosyltransferase [Priestia endophytica]KAB2488079.1 glycosyltransferase [Priestia endophytica]